MMLGVLAFTDFTGLPHAHVGSMQRIRDRQYAVRPDLASLRPNLRRFFFIA